MDPSDNRGDGSQPAFQLVNTVEAFGFLPVYEYKSVRTGLSLVIAEIEGPVVNGFFSLATEADNDDGLPHTLEHLIFLGSTDYPFKGVLDLLANRCLASGTNAWTDTDHTCYTMETAGSDGFLALLPIFLEHILFPTLKDEGFVTEVHHVTGKGLDSGVVYSEMQGVENSGESRVFLELARAMYPHSGYSCETGGILKNLRESTNNVKVREYHSKFYRPENLKIIICGQVKPEAVFATLYRLEEKILKEGSRAKFEKPWQTTVKPLEASKDIDVKFPCDFEDSGLVTVGWRGPLAATEQYRIFALAILLKYLTDMPVSPLQKEFVEMADPFANEVNCDITENSVCQIYITFRNVPKDKLHLIKPRLVEVLGKIAGDGLIDMARMHRVMHRYKLEILSNLETQPHASIACLAIGYMLYGNDSPNHLAQKLNPLLDLERLHGEPKAFWLDLLRSYMVDSNMVVVTGTPSIEEQHRMAEAEQKRIQAQIELLGPEGLRQKEAELAAALEFNNIPPPAGMLKSVPIPSTKSIEFIDVVRCRTDDDNEFGLNLNDTPIYTFVDHVKTNFVYINALMDTSSLDTSLRPYIPLFLEALFECPIKRGSQLLPYEDVIAELETDTVQLKKCIGIGDHSRFDCCSYANTVLLSIQVDESKLQRGIRWVRELLFATVFSPERIGIIATKMTNEVAQLKREGGGVCSNLISGLIFDKGSNQYANSMIRQNKFLNKIIKSLQEDDGVGEIIENLESVRKVLTNPCNMVLHMAMNLHHFEIADIPPILNHVLPDTVGGVQKCLKVTPDHVLKRPQDCGLKSCVVGVGSLESMFMRQVTPCITSKEHPDFPAIMLCVKYFTQLEGPMWKQVRGRGLVYSYSISLRCNEGLLYLTFFRSNNILLAYKETKQIIEKQLQEEEWNEELLESAKSCLIFELIDKEKTVGGVVEHSLLTNFWGFDYSYHRQLISLIMDVTAKDLTRVCRQYLAPLIDPTKIKTAIVSHPGKANEIAAGFKEIDINLEVYNNVDDSFINDW